MTPEQREARNAAARAKRAAARQAEWDRKNAEYAAFCAAEDAKAAQQQQQQEQERHRAQQEAPMHAYSTIRPDGSNPYYQSVAPSRPSAPVAEYGLCADCGTMIEVTGSELCNRCWAVEQATPPPPPALECPAKRGDVAVLHTTSRTAYLHRPNTTVDTYQVGIVTSITREGRVKALQFPNGTTAKADRTGYLLGVMVAPARSMDMDAFRAWWEQASRDEWQTNDLVALRDRLVPFRASTAPVQQQQQEQAAAQEQAAPVVTQQEPAPVQPEPEPPAVQPAQEPATDIHTLAHQIGAAQERCRARFPEGNHWRVASQRLGSAYTYANNRQEPHPWPLAPGDACPTCAQQPDEPPPGWDTVDTSTVMQFDVICPEFAEHAGTVRLDPARVWSWQPGCPSCHIDGDGHGVPAAAHWHAAVWTWQQPCPFVGCSERAS